MKPCRNGRNVAHRFRTALGHLRCRLCLRQAQARWEAKRVDSSRAYWRRWLREMGVAL